MNTEGVEVIECVVKEVNVEIGRGNRLILFHGDKVTISTGMTVHHRHRVMDSSGCVVGYITKRSLRCITNQPLRKHYAVAKK